jgi:uncharacterized protein (TIGR03083 family)
MSWSPTSEEIADRYVDARTRVVGLVTGLSDEQAATNVPGTPKWTVRELVSHLVGGPVDLMAGNTAGAGSDEWTQAQVDARRGRGIADLLAEWDSAVAGLESAIRAGHVPSPVSFDVITHEQDLRGALGAEPTPDPLAVRFVTGGFAARVDRVVAEAGLPPLELRDPDGGWYAGSPGGVCVEASEFEMFRALTGRRSGRQVSTLAWTGDPAPYLDLLSPFGPLRETDVSD